MTDEQARILRRVQQAYDNQYKYTGLRPEVVYLGLKEVAAYTGSDVLVTATEPEWFFGLELVRVARQSYVAVGTK